MQFNVAQLLMEPTGATREYEVAENITHLDPEFSALGPLVGELRLMRTHSGVLVTGELSTPLQVTCNRCLFPIAMPVRFDLEESFRPLMETQTGRFIRANEFEGTEEELEDAALLINARHILDLSEVVRQNIWLALPMYPNCNWEGPPPCPNLEQANADVAQGLLAQESEEETADAAVDPRWSALLELQRQLDE